MRDIQCVKIPDDVPLTIGGHRRLRRRHRAWARCSTGPTCSAASRAVVFGVGGVGLNVIQALKVQGATTIIAVDTVPTKEALAKQFGATHFLDGTRDDIVAAIGELAP